MKKFYRDLIALAVIALILIVVAKLLGFHPGSVLLGLLAAVGALFVRKPSSQKAPSASITPQEEAEARKVALDAEEKSKKDLAGRSAADVAQSGNADGHVGAERGADVDAATGGYRQNVLDRSREDVSRIFGDSGDRQDPAGGGSGS